VKRLATRIALAGLVGVLAGCSTMKTVTVTQTVTVTTTAPAPATAAACSGGDLGGSFRVVPGSPGAGGITYTLRLTNSSSAACYVSGIPQLQLVDAQGGALPTTVLAAHPGQATAAKIVLQPGKSARADARFSPDVPGIGEQTPGQCEPTSHRLKVTVGGGSLTVPVTPPTPVCEHGRLSMSLLAAAS
jgi:Protein of unknown function (DUF4232)